MTRGEVEEATGLLKCYVSRVENGYIIPTIKTLEKHAAAFNLPLYRLFYEGDEPPSLSAPPPREGVEDLVGLELLRLGEASANSVGVMGKALKNRPNWAVAALVGLCLVSGGQAFSLLGPAHQKLITAGEKDNKSKVSLPKEGVLIVRLGVRPGTGFRWQVSQCDRDRLESLGEPVFEASENAAPGSSEQQVFRFRARTVGSSVLELAYKRVWEKDVPPAKTFRITVMIQ